MGIARRVWERAQPLLPAQKSHTEGGRPPHDDRQMLGAMISVLRTGRQWNASPHEIGASTAVYDRFRAWERDGFFARLGGGRIASSWSAWKRPVRWRDNVRGIQMRTSTSASA